MRRRWLACLVALIVASAAAAAVTEAASTPPATYVSNGFAVGDSLRPFNGTFWSRQLDDAAPIDPSSASVVADLASQSGGPNGDMLNVWNWTSEPIEAPASTPLVKVTTNGINAGNSQLQAVLALGVPIPAGTKPTNDSDAELAIWQPDYTDAIGLHGRYYELFGVSQNADGTYNARGGGRIVGVNDITRGTFANWTASGQDPAGYATDPNSTYELGSWGAQGSGLPLMPGIFTLGDAKRGFVDHELLLEVKRARAGAHWGPATRSDGFSSTSLVQEGMLFRLPASFQIPAGTPYLQRLIDQAAMRFGIRVTDQAGTLAFRAAPSVGQAGYLGSLPDYAVLNGFPWHDLQLLAP